MSRASTAPFRIALIYAVFAALWILLSDTAVEWLFKDPDQIIRASMLKGWLFVGITSLLLYFLVRRMVGQLQEGHERELAVESERLRALLLLDTIVESSEDAIVAKDLEGRFVLFNRAAGRFIGKTAADALGRNDSAIFPPEQAELLRAAASRIVAGGKIEINECVLETATGPRVFHNTQGPLRDTEGRITGTFGISRDVSDYILAERALRASEARYRSVIDNLKEVIFQTDAQGLWTFLNPAWTEVTGFPVESSLGTLFLDYVHPDDRQRNQELFEPLIRREKDYCRHVIRYLHRDGGFRWIEVFARLTLDEAGGIVGTSGTLTDITERKSAEDELRARNEELERFNTATVDREFDIIELKKQVNTLSGELGRQPPYALAFLNDESQS